MSLPTSLGSYLDCRALYDAALADPLGARACLGNFGAAQNMRGRMHYFRKLDRAANAEIYPRGDPKHGVSIYDDYQITILADTNDEFWLYIRSYSAKVLAIEGLSQVEPIDVDGQEVRLIEDRTDG
jgi:hypothetical protein